MTPLVSSPSGIKVSPGWILTTVSLNAILLLFGLCWLMNLQITVAGIRIALPPSPYTFTASPDMRPVLVQGEPTQGLYFQDTFMDWDEFDQRLSHSRRPLQILLLPDHTVPVRDLVDLSNLILAHGHQVVLGTGEAP